MQHTFHDIVQKLMREKRKYHAKVLKDSAILIGFNRADSTFDIFARYVWVLSDYITNLCASLATILDIDPSEFENLFLKYKIRLPSVEEVLQGIYIEFEKIGLPDVSDIITYIIINIEEQYQQQLLSSRPKKAVYGETGYNYSYYDPVNVRRFIANVLTRLFQEHPDHPALKKIVDSARKAFNIHEGLSKYVFNRNKIVMGSQSQNFILGYGILGVSMLTPKEGDKAVVEIIDYNDRDVRVKYDNLDHVHMGFILGISLLGYGIICPRTVVYKKPSPRVTKWVQEKAVNTINRYFATPMAFANYAKPEERRDFLKSERADQYMALQQIRYRIENIVENTLGDQNLPPNILRQYKNACLQLVSLRYKRHRWGYKPFREMSDEELKSWWLEYWSRQGLNTSLLEKLYMVVGKWSREWGEEKERLGKIIRLRRKYRALWG